MSTTAEALRMPFPTAAAEVPGPSVRQRDDRGVSDGRVRGLHFGPTAGQHGQPRCRFHRAACWEWSISRSPRIGGSSRPVCRPHP